MPMRVDDLGRDVFYQAGQLRCLEVEGMSQTFGPHERIRSKVSCTRPRINQGYLSQFIHPIISLDNTGRRK
jgi:hypothetical protein